jgi:hypothetical protein
VCKNQDTYEDKVMNTKEHIAILDAIKERLQAGVELDFQEECWLCKILASMDERK